MKLIGFAGWSGSGKTTLITALIPLLQARGLRVSTIKHAHHGLDLDQPGKDSHRHRSAGAHEVLVVGGTRWALLAETPQGPPDLPSLAARLAPVDLVLVEGFKSDPIAKIEVYRPSTGAAPLWPTTSAIIAVATDAPLAQEPSCPHPVLPLNHPAAIAGWMISYLHTQT